MRSERLALPSPLFIVAFLYLHFQREPSPSISQLLILWWSSQTQDYSPKRGRKELTSLLQSQPIWWGLSWVNLICLLVSTIAFPPKSQNLFWRLWRDDWSWRIEDWVRGRQMEKVSWLPVSVQSRERWKGRIWLTLNRHKLMEEIIE